MDPNPYASPRLGEAVVEKSVVHGDPLLQVLSEIRDAQRELLELHRESVKLHRETANRTNMFRPYGLVMMLLPLLIMAFPIYRLMTMSRPTIPTPARRVPAPAMPPAPGTLPTAS
jgi:hypothetical protein